MTVVSEGVETAQQHQAVSRLGSDRCQGFYFAKPMLAASVDALIQDPDDGSNPRLPIAILSLSETGQTAQSQPTTLKAAPLDTS
jgi:predicted signal transduction protein with EAL and GGDEF domain